MLRGGAPCVVDCYMGYFERFIAEQRLPDLFLLNPDAENDYLGFDEARPDLHSKKRPTIANQCEAVDAAMVKSGIAGRNAELAPLSDKVVNTRKPSVGPERNDRLLREHIHDPYKTTKKLPEPTVCSVCNAVFTGGHWQWKESWPLEAHREVCHTCRRTKDGYPAGIVTLKGPFVLAHKQDQLQLARHHEERERAEHPMHRIMKIDERADTIIISTTDLHLPRRIADAVHHAYKGKLDEHYDEEGYLLRVNWSREE